MTIRKATVLGAGTMGSQIAALLVNAGLKVKLLDIVIDENDPNKISKRLMKQLQILNVHNCLIYHLPQTYHTVISMKIYKMMMQIYILRRLKKKWT